MASSPSGKRRTKAAGEREAELTRHEEVLKTSSQWVEGERVLVRKTLEDLPVRAEITRGVMVVDADRAPPEEEDDGQVHELDDGTLSIPILEEQIHVTRRTIVRERLLLHRQLQKERITVEETLRRERAEVVTDDGTPVEVHQRGQTAPFPNPADDAERRRPSPQQQG